MTAAKPDTWMPFYWGDYLRDTGHLSPAQHGSYMLLIGHYWTTGKPLPSDDSKLARIARMTSRQWRKDGSEIKAFFVTDGDKLRHKRIDEELKKAVDNLSAKSLAGKKSAAKRWGNKDSEANNKDIADPMADPSFCQWQTDAPSPSPSPSHPPSPSPSHRPTDNSDTTIYNNSSTERPKNINLESNGIIGSDAPQTISPAPRTLNRKRTMSQQDADQYAAARLAESVKGGWLTVMAAEDPEDQNHALAVSLCLATAKKIGVGWISPERRAEKNNHAKDIVKLNDVEAGEG